MKYDGRDIAEVRASLRDQRGAVRVDGEVAADWIAADEMVLKTMIDATRRTADLPNRTATVLAHERRSSDVAVVRLQASQALGYLAGEYCAVEIAARPRMWRYYSLANAPRTDGRIELHVKAVPGGLVSTAIVAGMQPGETVKLGPPRGAALTLDHPPSGRDVLLIAGGTGLAPLKALVEQIAIGGGYGRVTLVVGGRHQADLYDLPSLTAMAEQWPWLTVVPAVSDDTVYPGQRGAAVDVALRLDRRRDVEVYVCGSAAMVTATRDALQRAGIPLEAIRHEDETCDPYRPATSTRAVDPRGVPIS